MGNKYKYWIDWVHWYNYFLCIIVTNSRLKDQKQVDLFNCFLNMCLNILGCTEYIRELCIEYISELWKSRKSNDH